MKILFNLRTEYFVIILISLFVAYLLIMLLAPLTAKFLLSLVIIGCAIFLYKDTKAYADIKKNLDQNHYINLYEYQNEHKITAKKLESYLNQINPQGMYSDDLEYFFEDCNYYMYYQNAAATQKKKKTDMTDIVGETTAFLGRVRTLNENLKSDCIRCNLLLEAISNYSMKEGKINEIRQLKKRYLPTFNEVLVSYINAAELPVRTQQFAKIEELTKETLAQGAKTFEQIYDELLMNKSISLEGNLAAMRAISTKYVDFIDIAQSYLDEN